MNPRSYHIPKIASHIVHHLHTPDIVFVQEIQDDSGPRNDGVVSANRTLRTLANAIKRASGGVEYDFVNIEPEDNKDGGQPGGNIRVAYLFVLLTLHWGTSCSMCRNAGTDLKGFP